MQILDDLKVYFWDVSIDSIDLTKHRKFIIKISNLKPFEVNEASKGTVHGILNGMIKGWSKSLQEETRFTYSLLCR